MQTITVKTSQNIDIDYHVAGMADRLKARFVDYAIFSMLYVFLILAGLSFLDANSSNQNEYVAYIVFAWMIACALYDVIAEIFFNGQSVGKRVLRIRVVSLNGKRATVGQYLLRWIFRIIDFGITMGAAAMTSIAFTDNKQRVGDIIAGTVIIKTDPVEKLDDLTFNHDHEEDHATFREVLQLNDEDILLIRDIIRNFNLTGNNLIVYKLSVRIQEHLSITCPPEINDYEFLELILKDYDKLVV